MARVTEAEVKEIIKTDLTPLSPFIDTANILVDTNLLGKGLSTDLLTKIELWLSAHFTASHIDAKELKEEAMGSSKNAYAGKYDLGLDGTTYGQTAKTLDPTGTLSSLGKGTASLTVYDVE